MHKTGREKGTRVLPADQIRALLREFDDPHCLERPRSFDVDASARRFAELTRALEERFGPSCKSGLNQDTSDYGGISVPAEATGFGRPLWVGLSNFGCFVTAGRTSDWSEPDPTEGLTEEFVTWLDGVCTAAGCTFVPLAFLLEPYEGLAPTLHDGDRFLAEVLSASAEDDGDDEEGEQEMPPVWADRYFQWV
ncbi:hypothetical protein [Streptomyces sp. NPDC059757]|uniref:hypothetical protein n=1 Tax=Streptomyces sp. NPDC059757 TaxID=3346935 RepID=UPI003646BF80